MPSLFLQVKTLFVQNLTRACTGKVLEDLFHKYGSATVYRDKKNVLKNARVEFKRRDDAETAMKELDKHDLSGTKLKISWSKPKRDETSEGYQERLIRYFFQSKCSSTGLTDDAKRMRLDL